MIAFLLGIVIGATAKILIPTPPLDEKVREAYRWVARKIP